MLNVFHENVLAIVTSFDIIVGLANFVEKRWNYVLLFGRPDDQFLGPALLQLTFHFI